MRRYTTEKGGFSGSSGGRDLYGGGGGEAGGVLRTNTRTEV